ncbi:MAG: DNA-directed RNA polymerase subunit H [Nanoarchaeota archaeon]|nr:DNA-directed RNA polymerase subunit H [Nanoarchaeota archaeon]
MKKKIHITKHDLLPKHVKISEKEKKAILKKYQVTLKEMPKIMKADAALQGMKAEVGDMIKITRKSPTAGEAVYYRVVTDA